MSRPLFSLKAWSAPKREIMSSSDAFPFSDQHFCMPFLLRLLERSEKFWIADAMVASMLCLVGAGGWLAVALVLCLIPSSVMIIGAADGDERQ